MTSVPNFTSIPVRVNSLIPAGEIWLVQRGEAQVIFTPSVEALREEISAPTRVLRVINLQTEDSFVKRTRVCSRCECEIDPLDGLCGCNPPDA